MDLSSTADVVGGRTSDVAVEEKGALLWSNAVRWVIPVTLTIMVLVVVIIFLILMVLLTLVVIVMDIVP